jgi:hypothetical protein
METGCDNVNWIERAEDNFSCSDISNKEFSGCVKENN